MVLVGSVLPVWKYKYCGRRCVRFHSVSIGHVMFRSSSHACVVKFGVCNVGPLPSEGGITTARGEDKTFRAEGVNGRCVSLAIY
jgi:hypothetical protein